MTNASNDKFRDLLNNNPNWPQLYYFKFIVPNSQPVIDQAKALFTDPDAITYKVSKDIRYVGLSCKQWMPDADAILAVYAKAQQIEGLIAL